MRRFEFRRFFVGSLIVLGLSTAGAVTPANAQQDPYGEQTTEMNREDDGMDWGWLGLLGLAGLLGLRKRDRDEHVHRVDTTPRNRPNTP